MAGNPAKLVGDFFAFPGPDATTFRNGTFVAAGDVTGDGFADLVFGGATLADGVYVGRGGNFRSSRAGPVADV